MPRNTPKKIRAKTKAKIDRSLLGGVKAPKMTKGRKVTVKAR